MVAMATTIMNDAIVTYNTLHSEIEKRNPDNCTEQIFNM